MRQRLVSRRMLVAVACALAASASAPLAAAPEESAIPLLAHWKLEEPTGGVLRDAGPNGWHAPLPRRGSRLDRVPGVFGAALKLSGSHHLKIPVSADFSQLARISLSAWVRPVDLSSYREIFRKEDGNRRVLFSFQHGGTILSLGLNIDGYVECDARIEPSRVLDGAWHHCAATFDGQWMRVYLDGAEVGSLRRPGKIVAGGVAPGCIGSSNGGECFQGSLDDLRIWSDALPDGQIRGLYASGLKSVQALVAELAAELDDLHMPEGGTFSETLAALRSQLAARDPRIALELAPALVTRLKAAFPDPYADFVRWAGVSSIAYLSSRDAGLDVRLAEDAVELLVEYKPVTSEQRACQSPEDARRWTEVAAIEARFERLRARGDAARFSSAWIDLIVDASRRVEHRPRVSEAVAPYVRPSTVPTRDLTGDEAREHLERDWLHQADSGDPSVERTRSEIGWSRELAARIAAEHPGAVDFSQELDELDKLEGRIASTSDAASRRALYLAVRRVKRAVALANPVVDFDRVLLVDMPFPAGSEWPHETRHRLGYMAVPGGRLLVLAGLSPAGRLTQLMPKAPLHGSFWRPDVSYDGDKVLVSFKPHNEKAFHLYEIDADGSNLRQLTHGPYDDLDPVYLPDDENIVFSTTRGHTYVRCMPPTNAYVLARCRRDGRDIYLISRNNEPDYLPSVMDDGRLVYTRWEYTDKPLWRAQGLWTSNPDGTQVSTLWGNQSVWPDLLKDVRSIPGSRRVMFTGSAHHNWFSGSVGIVDPGVGFNFPEGLTKVTADVAWPESGDGPVDPIESPSYHPSGRYAAYYSPYPLSERDFLVSANRGGKFVLYLMDVDGNRELIYEGVHNIFHAQPLRARPRPPVIPDRVDWPQREERLDPKSGVLFSDDVRQGAPEELRRRVKYLRVLAIEPKTYTYWHKRPYISTGPVVSMVQSDGVKRILGTVPVEADGSVNFRVPSGQALHFQLLDERYRALQTMRSFTGVMPGEYRGCLGCHESHSRAPVSDGQSLALSRAPSEITPPPWGDESVGYERFVQPVLDEYCGECHQGDGEARKVLDLTLRPGFRMFPEPYVTLTGRPTWGAPYKKPANPPPGFGIANTILVEAYHQRDPQAYATPAPMTALSYKSPLIDLASSGEHYDVKVDTVSLRKLIAWIDAMCPLRGAEEIRAIPDPEFQGIDWLSIRPQVENAPRIVRPGPVD